MDDLTVLTEKQRIIDTLTDLFIGTDRRDWPAVLDCFTAEVSFDMSSLTGAAASTIPAKDIVAAWEQGLAPLQAVHHQAGNFRVRLDGDEATAFCYAIALHYLPNPSGKNTRTFVGSYDFRLKTDGARWRIALFRFNLKYVDGNLQLERSA